MPRVVFDEGTSTSTVHRIKDGDRSFVHVSITLAFWLDPGLIRDSFGTDWPWGYSVYFHKFFPPRTFLG